ncbi:phospholipase-like protein [Tanacetum coccineum]
MIKDLERFSEILKEKELREIHAKRAMKIVRVFDAKPTIRSRMRLIKDIKELLKMNSARLSFFKAVGGDEWHNIDDVDVIRLCLVMFMEFVLLGMEPNNKTHVHLLALVEDLDLFNHFPWGSYTWSMLYKSIRNVAWIHYHRVNVSDGDGAGEGGVKDRDVRMDSGIGMQDHSRVDTGVRMDTGFRMSSDVSMDYGVGKMPGLNFHEDDAMDDSNFGLDSGWLNSTSTPQGQFHVFSTPGTQAPQFQDPFITHVHDSITIREQHVDVVMEDVLRKKQPANPMPMPRMTTPLSGSEFMGAQQQTASMTHEFQAFYNSPAVERSAFPYFPGFRVYKGFWNRILCFTDNGYLDDSHIEAFVRLCVYKRPPDANWTAVDTFFTINLINNNYERVIKYASGHFGYPNWKTCSVVYIPIHDEQSNHWYLAVFDIRRGRILFFDSYEGLHIHDKPYFSSLLGNMGWFAANNVYQSQYKITFCYLYHVPQQNGSIVLRKSYQPHSLGKLYYACPRSKPSKQYYGCGYFIWKDDPDLQLCVSSSHGPSTPQVLILQGQISKDKDVGGKTKDVRDKVRNGKASRGLRMSVGCNAS